MAVRLSNKEKLNLISNLGTMLGAGIPLLEVIETLHEEAKGNRKKALEIILAEINEGNPIADALEKLPDSFDSVTVSLVRSAEESGNLDTILKDIKKNIKKNIEFNNKVVSALIYPALVSLLFGGIMVMILVYVIPRISEVFSKLKVQLPIQTKIMIAASDFFLAYWIAIAAFFVVFVATVIFLFKTRKRQITSILMSLPLISRLGKEIDLAKFTQAMGFLLSSGISITKAMEYSQHVVVKKSTFGAIAKANEKLLAGNPLAEGLGDSKDVFPIAMIRIIAAGEKSGSLEKSMVDLSEQFEEQVENTLKTVTTLMEPLLLIVIGFLVGGIMLAIIAPIYQMIGSISAR